MGTDFNRIDVVFDRYYKESIKCGTRQKRSRGSRPISREVEDRAVPLPSNLIDFIALPENKEDLVKFLSEQLIEQAPHDKILILARGFEDEAEVWSSAEMVDTNQQSAHQEEANTIIILHCVHSDTDSVVVAAQDTDVLILLLAHFNKMTCT
ncbi:UNVERIFIED_CONTAM: hypothetical protein FKN15_055833 [Acipenser sinensis]